MAEQWPTELQQTLNTTGFNEQNQDDTVRSNPDKGPAKQRRRFTKVIKRLTGQIWLTQAQYPIFDTFFDVTLNGGTRSFEFNQPVTGVLTEYRFVEKPVITPLQDNAGVNYVVSMVWETV